MLRRLYSRQVFCQSFVDGYFIVDSYFFLQFNYSRSLEKLIKFVVHNNHPYSIVEESDFKDFIQSLEPKMKLISAGALKDKIMETEVQMKFKLKEYFQKSNVGMPSTTTDLWTSGNHLSIMVVTMVWLDTEFVLKEIIIGFREIQGEHSGSNLSKVFVNILEDMGIKKVNFVNITSFAIIFFFFFFSFWP